MNLSKNRRIVFILATGGLLTLVMILLAFRPIRAAGPWYVAPGGDDGNDCLSPGAACATINGAITKASAGDTIYVATGTYTGTGDEVVLLDKDATLSGGWDETFTTQSSTSVVDGQELRRCMVVSGGVTAIVESFTFQLGWTPGIDAGGINNSGTLTLNDCTISGNNSAGSAGIVNQGTLALNDSTVSGNVCGGGGAISNGSGTVTLSNSTVSDNIGTGIVAGAMAVVTNSTISGNSGGGIRNYSGSLTLDDSTVIGNTGNSGGGIDNGGTLTLNNSSIRGNEVPWTGLGGGIRNSGTAILNNSTVSGNTTGSYIGGGIYNSGTLTLNNSTVSSNAAWRGGGIYHDAGTTILRNTILVGNAASDAGPDCMGSIGSSGYNLVGDTADCTFSATTGDLLNVDAGLVPLADWLGYFPLLPESLAIDAVPLAQCALATDQRGVARPQGSACDIGAYEYTIPGPAASIDAFGGTPQRTAPFTTFEMSFEALVLDSIGSPVQDALVNFSAPASGASGTFADSGTSATTDTTDGGGMATAAPFTANELEGSYTVTATVTGVVTPAHFLLSNIRWYVAPAGDDGNDCQTAATPCATVNGALGKPGFVGGDTVVVASGMYTGGGDEVVLLDKDATLSGGWDAAFTAQSGTSIIDGQVLRPCMAVTSDVTAVVEGFTFKLGWTSGLEAGGINNAGTLTLKNCTVSGNAGDYGGGIYNGGATSEELSTLILNDCMVSGNTADSGGGIYNYVGGSVLTLNNSTVSGNVANDGGGICNCGESGNGEISLIVNNSTVEGNSANWRGGGILNGHKVALNNSSVSGNTAPEGGGISNYHTVALHSSTLSGNTGQDGGGIRNFRTLTLTNSILAVNTASSTGPDCSGTIGSSGYNLIGDTTDCTFTATIGDLIDVDARLFPLVGLPGYHPLLPGSPAIDGGNPAGCTDHLGNPLTTDQRGAPRPLDGDGDGDAFCDMGSYEFDPEHPIVQVYLPIILRNY